MSKMIEKCNSNESTKSFSVFQKLKWNNLKSIKYFT